MMFFVTGDVGAGKSSFCRFMADYFVAAGMVTAGVISTFLAIPGHQEHGYEANFLPGHGAKILAYPTALASLFEVSSEPVSTFREQPEEQGAYSGNGLKHVLQWPTPKDGPKFVHNRHFIQRFKKFSFDAEVLETGIQNILNAISHKADFIILDEVGFWELEGGGWSKAVDELAASNRTVLLSVRKDAIEAIRAHWNLQNAELFNLDVPELALSVPGFRREGRNDKVKKILPEGWSHAARRMMQTAQATTRKE